MILGLLALFAIGFVADLLSEWAARRFGIQSGAEYIIAGMVMGPVLGWVGKETVIQVAPALVLCQGSLGLLVGIALGGRDPMTTGQGAAAGLVATLLTAAVMTVLPIGALWYTQGADQTWHYLPFILCAAAVASVAASGPIRTLIEYLEARGGGATAALATARACSSYAIVLFGIIFCISKPVSVLIPGLELSPIASVAAWFLVHIVFGAILGIIFTAFLVRDFEDEKILTVVIGMVIFSSGLAYYLKLSPIFVCFVLGVVLANICRQSGHVRAMLLSIERPLYVVIFVLFGTWATFDLSWIVVLSIGASYLVLRAIGRSLGGVAASRLVPSMQGLPPLGPVLLAPGALSAAMMLNFMQVFGEEPHAPEFFLAILLAMVVSEPIAHRFSRRWLIDATDVSIRQRSQTAEGSDDELEEASV